MKVLVTGAGGFVGKNLTTQLRSRTGIEVCAYEAGMDAAKLDAYCSACGFVFHLAGVNRPEHPDEFWKGNYGFTKHLLATLRKYQNRCPVMMASSIQAALDNPYGRSKKEAEGLFFLHAKETGAKIFVYRFPNIFGKWCRPGCHSVIATFCHNLARGLPIRVDNKDTVLQLVYIDDVVDEMIQSLEGHTPCSNGGRYGTVQPVYTATLGEIVDRLVFFSECRNTRQVPDMTPGSFSQKLYSTYLSYLPQGQFAYPLEVHADDRGSFTELLRTPDRGQFSVNIAKPGIEKGNHWHQSKNEKFIVVSGKALIRFRKVGCKEIIDYHVSGDKLEVVEVPAGYAHCIMNEGDTDLITFMWCNECYDQSQPDTYDLKVSGE